MPSTTIARGNALSTFYISAPLTPTAISGTSSTQTYQIAGLQTTDLVLVQGAVGSQTAGVEAAEADCLTAGVLTIQFGNLTATATLKPASGVYTLQIIRLEGNPAPTNAA